jgi:hypothetical protein
MVNMQTSNRESATMEVIISQKNLNVPINSATCSPRLSQKSTMKASSDLTMHRPAVAAIVF